MSVWSRLSKVEDELTGLYGLILKNPQDHRTQNIRENRRAIEKLGERVSEIEKKEKK